MNTPEENKHLIEWANEALRACKTWEWFHNVAVYNDTIIFMNKRSEALADRLVKYKQGYTLADL